MHFKLRLFESMDGVGTNEKDLIQILVRRHEVKFFNIARIYFKLTFAQLKIKIKIDLPAIKSEYKRLHQKRLQDAVYSETSGDFRKILMGLIGN